MTEPVNYETTDLGFRHSRGFRHYSPISTRYGHWVKVYESSMADAPHLWLAIDADESIVTGDAGELTALLTLGQAEALAATLRAAIDGHYQHGAARA